MRIGICPSPLAYPQYQQSPVPVMDKLLFWLGIGAAQQAGGSKPTVQRNWVVSLVVGTLIAALIIVGAFLVLVSQKL
jgi:hypothetical protein